MYESERVIAESSNNDYESHGQGTSIATNPRKLLTNSGCFTFINSYPPANSTEASLLYFPSTSSPALLLMKNPNTSGVFISFNDRGGGGETWILGTNLVLSPPKSCKKYKQSLSRQSWGIQSLFPTQSFVYLNGPFECSQRVRPRQHP